MILIKKKCMIGNKEKKPLKTESKTASIEKNIMFKLN